MLAQQRWRLEEKCKQQGMQLLWSIEGHGFCFFYVLFSLFFLRNLFRELSILQARKKHNKLTENSITLLMFVFSQHIMRGKLHYISQFFCLLEKFSKLRKKSCKNSKKRLKLHGSTDIIRGLSKIYHGRFRPQTRKS